MFHHNSNIDEYGFKRPENFDYKVYGDFMSEYYITLARRARRWAKLNDTERSNKSNKLKRYVRKGIPISERSSTWMIVSNGHKTKLTSKLNYTELKNEIKASSITDSINIDLPRTFPDNIYFSQNHTLPKQLFNTLATFAQDNAEVGYCQGLNYIAGLMLLATKSEETSFWLLKTLIENILPKYYIKNMSGLIIDMAVLDELVQIKEPAIYKHIIDIGMPWAVTTTKWFVCIYAEVLPTETVFRIWDCLFYEGSKIIFRVALTLIKLHKEAILNTRDLAEIVTCFKNMGNHPDVIDCHKFISVSNSRVVHYLIYLTVLFCF